MTNQLADLQLDYNSLKNDYYQIREENNKLQNQTHKDGEIIENQKYQLGKYAKENEELQEEIQALKVLSLRYLAVR